MNSTRLHIGIDGLLDAFRRELQESELKIHIVIAHKDFFKNAVSIVNECGFYETSRHFGGGAIVFQSNDGRQCEVVRMILNFTVSIHDDMRHCVHFLVNRFYSPFNDLLLPYYQLLQNQDFRVYVACGSCCEMCDNRLLKYFFKDSEVFYYRSDLHKVDGEVPADVATCAFCGKCDEIKSDGMRQPRLLKYSVELPLLVVDENGDSQMVGRSVRCGSRWVRHANRLCPHYDAHLIKAWQ